MLHEEPRLKRTLAGSDTDGVCLTRSFRRMALLLRGWAPALLFLLAIGTVRSLSNLPLEPPRSGKPSPPQQGGPKLATLERSRGVRLDGEPLLVAFTVRRAPIASPIAASHPSRCTESRRRH